MNCISTPLTQDQLIALMSDGLDESVAGPLEREHLNACPYCREQLARLQRSEQRLVRKVQYADCPPMSVLQEVVLDMLDEDARITAMAHIATCPDCTAEVTAMQAFLNTSDAPVAKRVPRRRLNAGVRPERRVLLPVQPRPMYALRGEDNPQQHVILFDEISLVLDAQEEENGLLLRGQLVGAGWRKWLRALVQVFQDAPIPRLALVDERGRFECPVASMSITKLIIYAPDRTALLVEHIDP